MEKINFTVTSEVLENLEQLADEYGITVLQLFFLGPTTLSQANKVGSTEIGMLGDKGEIKDTLKLPPKNQIDNPRM